MKLLNHEYQEKLDELRETHKNVSAEEFLDIEEVVDLLAEYYEWLADQ